ncbi:MAG: hypothetical protein DRP74_07190 [Candidatus Omnitrophota bacterium]|nr:MAG: hypothetical protein DRP74_07190 [Candidatus Omnitrophota bacterium]
MKIVLVNFNYSFSLFDEFKPRFLESAITDLPIGLLLLAAVLEKNNYETKIIDLAQKIRKGEISINKNFHKNVAKTILRENFDVLGFNTRCDTYPSVLNVARICKASRSHFKVVLGGPQATFVDEDTLKNFPFVDIVVRGEGELTLVDLMNHLKNNKNLRDVLGITFREDGNIIRNEERGLIRNLDSLPFPAYHLMDGYIASKKSFKQKYIPIHVGRGCPYECTFCIASLMDERSCRLRSPENILEEIEFLKKRYKINNFGFLHDNFLTKRENVEKMCNLLNKEKTGIHWACNSRIDTVDSELLKRMSRSGCKQIYFGIESASAQIRKSIKKILDISHVMNIVNECEKYGIRPTVSFIIGFPEEREEGINRTIELAFKIRNLYKCGLQFHLLTPIAGTKIFKQNKERLVFTGLLSDMADGPLAGLKENIYLIKNYPLIFSAFYTIKPKYLPLNLPYEIVDTFLKLSWVHPISCYITMKELKLEPLSLLQEFKKWMKNRGSHYRKEFTVSIPDIKKYFSCFLKNVYNQKRQSFNLVKGITEFEKRLCIKNIPKEFRLQIYEDMSDW